MLHWQLWQWPTSGRNSGRLCAGFTDDHNSGSLQNLHTVLGVGYIGRGSWKVIYDLSWIEQFFWWQRFRRALAYDLRVWNYWNWKLSRYFKGFRKIVSCGRSVRLKVGTWKQRWTQIIDFEAKWRPGGNLESWETRRIHTQLLDFVEPVAWSWLRWQTAYTHNFTLLVWKIFWPFTEHTNFKKKNFFVALQTTPGQSHKWFGRPWLRYCNWSLKMVHWPIDLISISEKLRKGKEKLNLRGLATLE